MPKAKKDKKIPLLESSFEEVLVCKKNNLKSRIEIFIQKPENISQQNLGTLAGIFEITDDSEDSSYIVNYLVSVIKKEYYSREKRGSIESFEAALHKTNLALAKIAEHGNTGWIGKINAIIAIFERNNIHIAQTGKVRAFLFRGKTLTDISEGSEESENLNPLKTFTDVISGRVENTDKIILTTEDIFDIFSFEEIKKSALKFSSSAFVQFLKTALINELEKASVLIADIKEKELPKVVPHTPKKDSEINAFSQASFSKYTKKESVPKNITPGEKQDIINNIKEDLKKESNGFVDKKTGHIYIKEDHFLKNEDSALDNFWENSRTKMNSLKETIFSAKWKSSLPKLRNEKNEKENEPEIIEIKVENKETEKISKQYLQSIIGKISRISSKVASFLKNYSKISAIKVKEFSKISLEKSAFYGNKVLANLKKNGSLAFSFLANKIKKLSEKSGDSFPEKEVGYSNEEISLLIKENTTKNIETIDQKEYIAVNKISPQENTTPKEEKISTLKNIIFSILPKFSRIKNLFSALNRSQKISAIFAIVLLLVVPYLLIKFQDNPKKEDIALEPEPAISAPLENDKNVSEITRLSETNTEKEILKIINLNDTIFLINKNEIIDTRDNEKYPVLDDFSEIETASNMDDLNLIFISNKNNKILSWSPSSKKFRDNQITFPEKTTISFQETYLTYLYVLDETNNQIYRYPRSEAEGGFGENKNWLKETAILNDVSDMTIGEDIFLVENGNVIKFSQGKKQPFDIEETATPIKADELYTKRKSQNLYVLDKTNARIIKLDLEGKIISQFYNSAISEASDFEIVEKEESNTAYFSIENKLISFEI